MPSSLRLFMVALAVAFTADASTTTRNSLLELRSRAYDANFRNDAQQLRGLAESIAALSNDADVGPMAVYYAAWTDWAVFNSDYEAGRKEEAHHALESALKRARSVAESLPNDADAHALLANILIGLAVTTPDGFRVVAAELTQARRRALELGPSNPRVVQLDAGMIFNTPTQFGGSQERGLQRWAEAIELFNNEARSADSSSLKPQWGRALAYGWLSELYLSMTPTRTAEARIAASTALSLRPDFWYVKERVLPRLKH